MGAILSFIGGNPMVILGIIGAITFTSWAGDVRSWWQSRKTEQIYVEKIVEFKQAANVKEAILNNALEANRHAEDYINSLQAQFEAESISRNTSGAVDCNWTDADLRLLNGSGPKRR